MLCLSETVSKLQVITIMQRRKNMHTLWLFYRFAVELNQCVIKDVEFWDEVEKRTLCCWCLYNTPTST